SRGVVVRVRRGIRDFLSGLRAAGHVVVSTLSWNDPELAMHALRVLGLLDLFDHVVAENHPRKDLMMLGLLRRLEERGTVIRDDCIIYIDDRDIHVGEIRRAAGPGLVFIKAPPSDEELAGRLGEALRIVEERKNTCGQPRGAADPPGQPARRAL
ncbi:MAG: magnesium-dependent phosphatase-1, partial [Candidatus Korarchaeota archaeon]|nr:magnesium-dependent phosphatase-1 [Candidatus Korarchaeota archaeon]